MTECFFILNKLALVKPSCRWAKSKWLTCQVGTYVYLSGNISTVCCIQCPDGMKCRALCVQPAGGAICPKITRDVAAPLWVTVKLISMEESDVSHNPRM